MKTITTKKGEQILVDDEDYEYLKNFTWGARGICGTRYAYNGTIGLMHRVILGLSDRKITVDHKDRNGLNNQKENLRIATSSENACNKNPSGEVKYLGVTKSMYSVTHYDEVGNMIRMKCKRDKYIAKIAKKGKTKYLGIYKTPEEAALAYNKAAIEIHGEFANLNKV